MIIIAQQNEKQKFFVAFWILSFFDFFLQQQFILYPPPYPFVHRSLFFFLSFQYFSSVPNLINVYARKLGL